MKIEELMVLNMAINGKDVFGLPSFDSVGKSEMLIQSIKNELIRKGILESETSFTMKGIRYVKNMKDYKEAKKYVLLGPVLFGVINKKHAIALEIKDNASGYEFQPVLTKEGYVQLCEIYPFLKTGKQKKAEPFERKISFKELKEAYEIRKDSTISISTFSSEGIKLADEIIFSAKDGLCFYDRISETLIEQFSDTEMIIRERMS